MLEGISPMADFVAAVKYENENIAKDPSSFPLYLESEAHPEDR